MSRRAGAGEPRRATARATVLRGARTAAAGLGGLVLVYLAWWVVSLGADPIQVPAPGDVLTALRDDWNGIAALEYVGFQTGGIRDALVFTTLNVLIGVGIGAACGVVVGTITGASAIARAILGPPLLVAGTTPVLVILPFLLIWFGTARLAQSGLVIFFALVTVAAVTQEAVTNVGARYGQYAASLGASPGRTMRAVIMPAVAPEAIGAIRVSAAAGWSLATVAELLGGQHGVGKAIQAMAQLQRTADVLAVVLALAVCAVLLDFIIATTGRVLVAWQE